MQQLHRRFYFATFILMNTLLYYYVLSSLLYNVFKISLSRMRRMYNV